MLQSTSFTFDLTTFKPLSLKLTIDQLDHNDYGFNAPPYTDLFSIEWNYDYVKLHKYLTCFKKTSDYISYKKIIITIIYIQKLFKTYSFLIDFYSVY